MKLKIEGTLLKDCIGMISDLIPEVQFKADSEKLSAIDMDPANVAMVIFGLPSASCIEYDVQKEETFAVNLAEFTKILKRTTKDDFVALETTKEGKLSVKINNLREFTFPLIEIEEEKKQKEPELKLAAKMEVATKLITASIQDVDLVSESVKLEVTQGHLALIGEADLVTAKVDMNSGDDLKISGEFGEKVASKFAIEYLLKMLKPSLAKEMTIELGKDYPLRMSYKSDKFFLRYILAPRVETD